ncbi:MAG TPA: response regulator [Myxococcales bacterium]|nr:response regulator [Myxococcales bacterium]
MLEGSPAARILIVEDYADARDLYVEYFRSHGFDVLAAANGLEALEVARQHRPDVIVLDVALPKLDGFPCSSASVPIASWRRRR